MKGAASPLTDVLNLSLTYVLSFSTYRCAEPAPNWEWRAECGKLRAEFGEWRVELKALVCLPCKGRGTAERWRGFD